MALAGPDDGAPRIEREPRYFRGRLFRKYAAYFAAVVAVALISNTLLELWFYYREYRAMLLAIERAHAATAAEKIGQFIGEIERQIAWTVEAPAGASAVDAERASAARLLRMVPAITEFARLDATGRERLRVARDRPEVVGSGLDRSRTALFEQAVARGTYRGPVYRRGEAGPHLTVAMASTGGDAGVSVAEIDLKVVWDIVLRLKLGEHGQAYLVDAQGGLLAHPDADLLTHAVSSLPDHVKAALANPDAAPTPDARDFRGRPVLSANAAVAPLGWLLFLELPVEQLHASLVPVLTRSGLHLLAALGLAIAAGLLLARRMIGPVHALRAGAARIGDGDLGERISIRTGDELEALGDQFNQMAARLQESYATLEGKVADRTRELALANLAKSRFLAAASHDLRQPLHALGLYVAQLRAHVTTGEGGRLAERIDATIAAMNELFNALLDISRLDAGVLTPELAAFPVERLLQRIETTFAGAAHEKGLRLRVVETDAWVRSDFILLERTVLNLVSNAVRYTAQGGVLIGCRRRGAMLRIEVHDTGPGIPAEQQRNVFAEFYQLAGSDAKRQGGLGLGLAIVERLSRLLGHPLELVSALGKGSCFAVSVPLAAARPAESAAPLQSKLDVSIRKRVVIIDDDAQVLDSMGGLLRTWGCEVVAAGSLAAILARLGELAGRPDLIICDYRLSDRHTGIDVIERLRTELGGTIPAFLISADTAPDRLREARDRGYHLLHKPVRPMALRAMLTQMLKRHEAAVASD